MAKSLTPSAVDAIYKKLIEDGRGKRYRSANLAVDVSKKAWTIVQRNYPSLFHDTNPFIGLERIHKVSSVIPATRQEAYEFARGLEGTPDHLLGLAALICFEWLQRPENVLSGYISWTGYRPQDYPNHVHIFHHKTGERIWQPMENNDERFYPEIEDYISRCPRHGSPMVLLPALRGSARPYSRNHAQARIRKLRSRLGIGDHFTLTACRHGGMTELGDAQLTEQEIMALSAHKSPDAARLYVKRTENQRVEAARKRRMWVGNQNK